MRVLLVCTGNTCRSSMAEVLLKQIVEENDLSESITVESAGIAALDGMPAADNAIAVMKERGLNLQEHKSRLINSSILAADLILTMTNRHKKMLINYDNSLEKKTFTLKELAGEEINLDIIDPYGSSIAVYRKTADEIKKFLDIAWDKKLKTYSN